MNKITEVKKTLDNVLDNFKNPSPLPLDEFNFRECVIGTGIFTAIALSSCISLQNYNHYIKQVEPYYHSVKILEGQLLNDDNTCSCNLDKIFKLLHEGEEKNYSQQSQNIQKKLEKVNQNCTKYSFSKVKLQLEEIKEETKELYHRREMVQGSVSIGFLIGSFLMSGVGLLSSVREYRRK
jgi:hypothetical protein